MTTDGAMRRVYFWRNVKWDKKSIQEYFSKRLRDKDGVTSSHGKGPRRITDHVRRYSIVRSPSRQVTSVSLQQQTVSRRRQVGLGRTRPAKETNPICGDKTGREVKRKEEAWARERVSSTASDVLIEPSGTWTMTNEKPCPFWFAHVTTTTTAILARYPIVPNLAKFAPQNLGEWRVALLEV
ncbi:hypothetical protein G5I_12775 [Acromyrmex echinatior]|uniref:Uncharacterized protein n=1 Tax=Acromyrmex echinatior TaxID=103372 RepID=F4X383_ACREC|nr:hypothetical protein G5I_12775 [Acromyrmex echinatior]